MFLAVKGNESGEKVQNYNGTWNHNYKWKPPEENTIDFRVTFDKDKKDFTLIIRKKKMELLKKSNIEK